MCRMVWNSAGSPKRFQVYPSAGNRNTQEDPGEGSPVDSSGIRGETFWVTCGLLMGSRRALPSSIAKVKPPDPLIHKRPGSDLTPTCTPSAYPCAQAWRNRILKPFTGEGNQWVTRGRGRQARGLGRPGARNGSPFSRVPYFGVQWHAISSFPSKPDAAARLATQCGRPQTPTCTPQVPPSSLCGDTAPFWAPFWPVPFAARG